jgi:alpha-soluble NSF attachment protein
MADAAKRDAQKAEASVKGGFFSFGSAEDKIENAAEAWKTAANLYVKENKMQQASDAWVKCAELRAKLKDNYSDTANAYNDGAKCIRQTDPAKAAALIERAVDAFVSGGNTRRASSISKDLAEIYQLDLQDYQKAIEWSEQGFTWLMLDNATGLACKEKIRAAELQAIIGKYFEAGKSFREAAKLYQRTNISRFSVKPTLFCAGSMYF